MSSEKNTRTIQSVQTALEVLALLRKRNGCGVTEVANEIGRSKATIHQHLATLVEHEYVVQDGDEYRLSLKHLELGHIVKERIPIYEIVKEELNELAEECGEIAQFATVEHGQAVYVYKTSGENAVRTASNVGKHEYMHCIALGKAMLAHMTEERVGEILDRHGMPKYTENTVTTREELFAELETIRELGYAYDRQELIEGLRCVAAPVTNDDVLGAVSISGPATRIEGEYFEEELPEMVLRSSNVIEINARFGG